MKIRHRINIFTSHLAEAGELLFPRVCLVCDRPLRRHRMCSRCTPEKVAIVRDLNIARCSCCFSPLACTSQAVEDGWQNTRSNVCEPCRNFPLPFNSVRFLWLYGGLQRDLIRAMKYKPSPWLARWAGTNVAEHLTTLFQGTTWDVIVPMPCSPRSYRRRLFNQCELLARPLIRAMPYPPRIARALKVTNHTRAPQAQLPHAQRLKGLRDYFKVHRPSIEGRRVLLVEDVITTGTTSAVATLALKDGGAITVDILALARAPTWSRYRSRVHELCPFEGPSP